MSLTIADRIRHVHAKRCEDQLHRYRSWEHCYKHFQAANSCKAQEDALQLACLHLGFYLASWGMYRGSSFLLQKDYLVHGPAVRCILNPAHGSLWNCDARILRGDTSFATDVYDLANTIKYVYLAEFKKSRDDRRDKCTADLSDTLVTKVLLGTMGCCPAYDEYFVKGVTGTINPARFGIRSLKAVIAFVGDNRTELLAVQKELAVGSNGVRYPLMKLVDMGFWQKGNVLNEVKK